MSLIFDYGGTLDTGGIHWADLIWQAYQQAGIGVGHDIYYSAYVDTERRLGREPIIRPSHTFPDVLRTKLQMQFEALSINDGKRQTQVLDLLLNHVQRTLEQTRTVLQRLAQRHTLILVSNFYGNLPSVLRDYELAPFFSDVIESAAVGLRKPDPAIFRLALERNRLLPGEALVVGDSMKNDILPAHELGCPTVWLQPSLPATVPQCATYCITRLSQLLDLLPSNG